MDELSRALLQIIVTLVSVIGTLVATFLFYLPRRDRNRNRNSNPGHNPGHNPGEGSALEDLLREVRDAAKETSEHHVREEQLWAEWARTFVRLEGRKP